MSAAYYNEIDPYAAQWLRNLITRGLIAPGEVDERSIEDVMPADLAGFTQCHFFAGIGVWSHALRQAGWSDDRPVWTGSCPCQPFSEAGKGAGAADERHLWPAFFHLISQCRPVAVFGEQVEAAIKHSWLDLVQTDLEGIGYTTGALGLCAAGVGAPHIRQRLYFVGAKGVANTQLHGRDAIPVTGGIGTGKDQGRLQQPEGRSAANRGGVAHPNHKRLEGWPGVSECADQLTPGADGLVGGAGNTNESGRGQWCETATTARHGCATDTAGWTNGFWQDADWLPFRDSKIRPVEPGTFPMAPRTPNHVGRCRAYGNAIVAPLATEFIKAYMSLTL